VRIKDRAGSGSAKRFCFFSCEWEVKTLLVMLIIVDLFFRRDWES